MSTNQTKKKDGKYVALAMVILVAGCMIAGQAFDHFATHYLRVYAVVYGADLFECGKAVGITMMVVMFAVWHLITWFFSRRSGRQNS